MITARQILSARSLLRMSQEQLAFEAAIPLDDLRHIETGRKRLTSIYAAAIHTVLQQHDVEFDAEGRARVRPSHLRMAPYSYY